MKFPSIKAVAARLREVNQELPDCGDVRLLIVPAGTWTIVPASVATAKGDLSGIRALPGPGKRFDSEEIAKNLLSQARAQAAASGVQEPDKAPKAPAVKLRYPSIEVVVLELRSCNARAEGPYEVRLKIETDPAHIAASGWSWSGNPTPGSWGVWPGLVYGGVTVPGKGARFDARAKARTMLAEARLGPRRSPEEDARADAIIETMDAEPAAAPAAIPAPTLADDAQAREGAVPEPDE